MLKLNTEKSSTSGSIPATILKQSGEIYLPFLTNAINLPISKKKSEVVIPFYKNRVP